MIISWKRQLSNVGYLQSGFEYIQRQNPSTVGYEELPLNP